MGARNEEKAQAAIEKLHAEGLGPGNGQVLWLKLNLSDPREVVKAAQELMQKEERLDVLGTLPVVAGLRSTRSPSFQVNNAAV